MIKPTLIHPVSVIFCNPDVNQDEINEFWDDVDWEDGETGISYLPEAEITGQVKYYKFEMLEGNKNGFQPLGDGFITVYPEDALKIKKAAKIIMISNEDVEFYVKEKKPCAHYEGQPRLFKIFFISKKKGK